MGNMPPDGTRARVPRGDGSADWPERSAAAGLAQQVKQTSHDCGSGQPFPLSPEQSVSSSSGGAPKSPNTPEPPARPRATMTTMRTSRNPIRRMVLQARPARPLGPSRQSGLHVAERDARGRRNGSTLRGPHSFVLNPA